LAIGGIADHLRPLAPRSWLLVVLALVLAVAGGGVGDDLLKGVFCAGAATLVALALTICLGLHLARSFVRREESLLTALVAEDPAPCFTTDVAGQIGYLNAAARQRFAAGQGQRLVQALGDYSLYPGALLFRLQSRAAARGAASEDLVTRRGSTRLSVHRVSAVRFLWRFDEVPDRRPPGRSAELLSLPMLMCNRAGSILFMNEAMRHLLGARPRQIDQIFTNPAQSSGEETVTLSQGGTVRAFKAEVEGPGGRREIYLLPLPVPVSSPGLRADVDHLPVALVTIAGDGSLLAANLAARDLLQIPAAAGVRLPDLLEGLGRSLSDWIGDVIADRSPGGAEVLRLRTAPAETFVQVTLRRIVDEGRSCVLAVLNDATAHKTLEAQFTQSQKMQAIGQLAGGIAHDFNNLLTAISGHCDLLLLRQDSDGLDYADLVQIRQNANRAASLVGQLLAFSRKQTLMPQHIDLYDVLSDLAHLLNRLMGERMRLELQHAPGLGLIRADKRQLEQVVINLVVNARDAMSEGGTIRISTETVTLRQAMHRDRAVVPPGNYALIRVADTGHGIPPDRITKIFDPFYTTKRPGEGTGLGLSTAYGIVKQSGGFIFVDSEPGVGTTFLLYFPINAQPAPARVAAPAPAPAPAAVPMPLLPRPMLRQGEAVVLLVEDEAPVRAFAARALRLRGYVVLESDSAEAALSLLEDCSVQGDIIVTDVVMPGLDGPSWVRKALERRPQTRVVFVSGYAQESFAEAQGLIPNSVFLPKPFSLTDLTATVQGQLLH
jgi:two-component system cell cycle sensor histidine kinase/response regulator CckA